MHSSQFHKGIIDIHETFGHSIGTVPFHSITKWNTTSESARLRHLHSGKRQLNDLLLRRERILKVSFQEEHPQIGVDPVKEFITVITVDAVSLSTTDFLQMSTKFERGAQLPGRFLP